MKRTYEKSGKVGDLVYQRNRFGPICYKRFVPANPRTERQVAVRSHLATVSSYWRLLSDLERLLWAMAGAQERTRRRLGPRAPLTGFNYFMKVNLRRLNRGGTLTEVPPSKEPQRSVSRPVEQTATLSVRRSNGVAPVLLRWRYGILSVLPRCWNVVRTLLEGEVQVLSA